MTDTGEDLRSDRTCVPEELQRRVPRKVCVTTRGLYYIIGTIIVSGFFLAFVIVGSIIDARLVARNKQLASQGHLAYTTDLWGDGRFVSYAFNCNGQTYYGHAHVPEERRAQVARDQKSGSFPVLYLPGDPSINYPVGWKADTSPFLKCFFSLLVIVQWSILVRFGLRDLRLVRGGAVAEGRVTRCWYGGRNGSIQVSYQFSDSDGALWDGKGEYPTPQQVGASICVLYFPNKIWNSRPYPTAFFRAG